MKEKIMRHTYALSLKIFFCIMTLFISFSPHLVASRKEKLAHALERAKAEIDSLVLYPDEYRHLIEYLEFYASWCAGGHHEQPENAQQFIERLQEIAQPLKRKAHRRFVIRLSQEEGFFYRAIIEMLRIKL